MKPEVIRQRPKRSLGPVLSRLFRADFTRKITFRYFKSLRRFSEIIGSDQTRFYWASHLKPSIGALNSEHTKLTVAVFEYLFLAGCNRVGRESHAVFFANDLINAYTMSIHLPPPTQFGDPVSDPDDSSSSDDDEDQTWEDWASGSETQECKSLFDEKMFPSVEAALTYDEKTHKIALNDLCKTLGEF